MFSLSFWEGGEEGGPAFKYMDYTWSIDTTYTEEWIISLRLDIYVLLGWHGMTWHRVTNKPKVYR